MKKILLFTLLLSASIIMCGAQNMSVESFTMVENDMDARLQTSKRVDQNGRTAALIKVQTILKGFAFDVGTMGVVDVVSDKVAEVWVYVPQGVIRMNIRHPQLGSLDYEFPISIKEATVYKLALTSNKVTTIVEQAIQEQYLIVKTTPAECEVSIDGGAAQRILNGSKNLLLSRGAHSYRVSAPLYVEKSGMVNIGENRVELPVKLEPDFGYLDIRSTPEATLEINGLRVGTTPYKSDKLQRGEYRIKLTASEYDSYQTTVTLSRSEATEVVNQMLSPLFSTITLSTDLVGAYLYINREQKGQGRWQGTLMPGTYEVEVKKDGYRDTRRTIEVSENTPLTLKLDSPTPMYGRLNVNTDDSGVMVSVDDILLGDAPNIFSNILAGERTVTITKAGYATEKHTVKIEEGGIAVLRLGAMRSTTPQTAVKSTAPSISTGSKVFTATDYKNIGSPADLVIPDGYTAIGEKAFYVCKTLKTITIPSSVKTIGVSAFSSCKSLTSVTLSNGLNNICKHAFLCCSNLTSINIPSSVTTIGDGAFYECVNLPYINIPNSVTTFGYVVFNGCTKLTIGISKSSTIYNSVKSFNYPLKSLPNETTSTTTSTTPYTSSKPTTTYSSTGSKIFTATDYKNMGSPANLVIPDGYTSIGEKAFYISKTLKTISIPSSVKTIGVSAFSSCKTLTSITISSGLNSIGKHAFLCCSSLTSINIPSSVTTINDGAFYECVKLSSITIPSSVTTFGHVVFMGCSRLTVTVPKSSPAYSKIKSTKGVKVK